MINVTALKQANPDHFSRANAKIFGASPIWQRANRFIMYRSTSGKHSVYPVYAVNNNLTLGELIGRSCPGLSRTPTWDRIKLTGKPDYYARITKREGLIIPL